MKKKSHVFRGVASIFLALMVILGIVGQVANNWAGKVNELLGVSDATIERSRRITSICPTSRTRQTCFRRRST